MIISKTPYRISFFGGGSDYPAHFLKHGGAVLSTTIDKYAYLSARYLPPFFEHKYRVVWSRVENVQTIDEIQHPIVRETLRYLPFAEGVVVNHDGDIPAQSGLGTSSTFTVGLLNALHVLRGDVVTDRMLANEAIHVEQTLMKRIVGNQDHVAAAMGGLNLIEFNSRGFTTHKVKLERQKEFENHLMLVFCGFPHNSNDVAATYQFDKTKTLKAMSRMAYAGMTIIERGDWHAFGDMLHNSWQLKCELSPEICPPYINYIYETAKRAGATGGKLLGAGGGGFMLLVCEPEKQAKVKQALKGMLFVPFELEHQGSRIVGNGH